GLRIAREENAEWHIYAIPHGGLSQVGPVNQPSHLNAVQHATPRLETFARRAAKEPGRHSQGDYTALFRPLHSTPQERQVRIVVRVLVIPRQVIKATRFEYTAAYSCELL